MARPSFLPTQKEYDGRVGCHPQQVQDDRRTASRVSGSRRPPKRKGLRTPRTVRGSVSPGTGLLVALIALLLISWRSDSAAGELRDTIPLPSAASERTVVVNGVVKERGRVLVNEDGSETRIGEWTEFSDDGRVQARGGYSGGERSGVWLYFDESGHSAKEMTFSDGKLHGRYKILDENGKTMEVGHYSLGKLSGVQTKYAADGLIVEYTTYLDGVREGEYRSAVGSTKGTRVQHGRFVSDRKEGLWTEDRQGVDRDEQEYRLGLQHGEHRFTDYVANTAWKERFWLGLRDGVGESLRGSSSSNFQPYYAGLTLKDGIAPASLPPLLNILQWNVEAAEETYLTAPRTGTFVTGHPDPLVLGAVVTRSNYNRTIHRREAALRARVVSSYASPCWLLIPRVDVDRATAHLQPMQRLHYALIRPQVPENPTLVRWLDLFDLLESVEARLRDVQLTGAAPEPAQLELARALAWRYPEIPGDSETSVLDSASVLLRGTSASLRALLFTDERVCALIEYGIVSAEQRGGVRSGKILRLDLARLPVRKAIWQEVGAHADRYKLADPSLRWLAKLPEDSREPLEDLATSELREVEGIEDSIRRSPMAGSGPQDIEVAGKKLTLLDVSTDLPEVWTRGIGYLEPTPGFDDVSGTLSEAELGIADQSVYPGSPSRRLMGAWQRSVRAYQMESAEGTWPVDPLLVPECSEELRKSLNSMALAYERFGQVYSAVIGSEEGRRWPLWCGMENYSGVQMRRVQEMDGKLTAEYGKKRDKLREDFDRIWNPPPPATPPPHQDPIGVPVTPEDRMREEMNQIKREADRKEAILNYQADLEKITWQEEQARARSRAEVAGIVQAQRAADDATVRRLMSELSEWLRVRQSTAELVRASSADLTGPDEVRTVRLPPACELSVMFVQDGALVRQGDAIALVRDREERTVHMTLSASSLLGSRIAPGLRARLLIRSTTGPQVYPGVTSFLRAAMGADGDFAKLWRELAVEADTPRELSAVVEARVSRSDGIHVRLRVSLPRDAVRLPIPDWASRKIRQAGTRPPGLVEDNGVLLVATGNAIDLDPSATLEILPSTPGEGSEWANEGQARAAVVLSGAK